MVQGTFITLLQRTLGPIARAGAVFTLLLASALAQAQTVTYFHNDPSGTPVLATDASGNVVWKQNYQPYGARLNNPAAEANNRLGFAGKPYDPGTGLSYMGARYYDPQLGRFLGVDPAQVAPENINGFNRYAYANNNPYRYVDPDGHSPVDVAFLAWDLGKLGVAIFKGDGVGAAAVDVGLSAIGVISPVPLAGQAIKAARAAEKAVEVGRAVEHGVTATKGAAETLPLMKGMGASERAKALSEAGFSQTKVSNSAARNETWRHADGSEVRVHPYGNQNVSAHKSGNNAHLHKQDAGSNQLSDRGIRSTDPNATHIGLPNPSDLPTVRSRPHGY